MNAAHMQTAFEASVLLHSGDRAEAFACLAKVLRNEFLSLPPPSAMDELLVAVGLASKTYRPPLPDNLARMGLGWFSGLAVLTWRQRFPLVMVAYSRLTPDRVGALLNRRASEVRSEVAEATKLFQDHSPDALVLSDNPLNTIAAQLAALIGNCPSLSDAELELLNAEAQKPPRRRRATRDSAVRPGWTRAIFKRPR